MATTLTAWRNVLLTTTVGPTSTTTEYTVTVGPAYPDQNALGSGYNPGKYQYQGQTQAQTTGQVTYNSLSYPVQFKPPKRQEKQTTLGDMAKCKVCGGFYPPEMGECPDDHQVP